jgi:tRNA A-37 threonylcarbamoyl transferase component Bud32
MSSAFQFSVGTIIAGNYRVLRPLSEGGMGAVYVVEQVTTKKQRALKVMHPQLVGDARLRERFVQEAQIGASIDSDHVVEVIDAGIDPQRGLPWLAMELLQGETLAARIQRMTRLTPAVVREIFAQLCHAIGAAHDVSIVHRDLKPENIFLAASRREGVTFTIKVLDFGIAKLLSEMQTRFTQALGTPMFMSPEQMIPGRRVAPSTDVWALGLIAYNALTGRLYWRSGHVESPTAMMTLNEVANLPLDRATVRAAEQGVEGLPEGFDAWFARCLDRDPESRFANAREARAALDPILAAAGGANTGATIAGSPALFEMALRGAGSTGESEPAAAPGETGFLFPDLVEKPASDDGPSGPPGAPTEFGVGGPPTMAAAPAALRSASEAGSTATPTPTPPPAGATVLGGPALGGSAPGGPALGDAGATAAPVAHDARATELGPSGPRIAAPPGRSGAGGGMAQKALLAALAVGAVAVAVVFMVSGSEEPQVTATQSAEVPTTSLSEAPVEPSASAAPKSEGAREFAAAAFDSGARVPAFSLERLEGDSGKSWLDALAACRAADMALCSELQWQRACAVDRTIGDQETWTLSWRAEGPVIAGGQGCATRVSSGANDARAGVCCTRGVGVVTQSQMLAVVAQAEQGQYEAALNKKDLERLQGMWGEELYVHGKKMSQAEARSAQEAWFRQHPVQWTYYDVCDLSEGDITLGETQIHGGMIQDCQTIGVLGDRVVVTRTRFGRARASSGGRLVLLDDQSFVRKLGPVPP